MKTTLDLPDDLVRKMKIRAVQDGRKLKELAAELLRKGLSGPVDEKKTARPVVKRDKKTGLPIIHCRRAAPRGQELTPRRVAKILADQEVHSLRESA